MSGRGSLWQACQVCENRTSRQIAAWLGRRSLALFQMDQPAKVSGSWGDGRSALPCRPLLLLDDLATKADALVADVDARPSDQPAYFALRLPTERAAQRAIDPLRGWRALEHEPSVFPFGANSHAPWACPSAADTAGMGDRNVLGGELEPCGTGPVTGFYRDGCCRTGPDDQAATRFARW